MCHELQMPYKTGSELVKNIFVELNIDQAKHLMMSKKENLNTPCLSLMARFVGGNWKCHMTDRYVPLVMLDF